MNEGRRAQIPTPFLDRLCAEVQAIGERQILDPLTKTGEEESEIGILDMEGRMLYTRFRQLTAELKTKSAEVELARTLPERTKLLCEVRRLNTMLGIAKEHFWMAVKDKHDLWDEAGDSIAIRTGFKVVSIPGGGGTLAALLGL